jgi:hypothetical protein
LGPRSVSCSPLAIHPAEYCRISTLSTIITDYLTFDIWHYIMIRLSNPDFPDVRHFASSYFDIFFVYPPQSSFSHTSSVICDVFHTRVCETAVESRQSMYPGRRIVRDISVTDLTLVLHCFCGLTAPFLTTGTYIYFFYHLLVPQRV